MKKLMTTSTLAFLAMSLNLHAYNGYEGPKDNTFQAKHSDKWYGVTLLNTTLGPLARYSDVIGVGQVSQRTNDHFVVTVDHALVGCTNGAALLMYGAWEESGIMKEDEIWEESLIAHYYGAYFPTNQGRIVFAACTNMYATNSRMYWSYAEIPVEPMDIREQLSLRYLNRSWWYADRDDGLLLTQFTNVLQAVRFDQNWTNYFYLCRDGANSPSNRVREDSFWDLRDISVFSTDEQAQFILDDPLVDPKHKNMILLPGWRYPNKDF